MIFEEKISLKIKFYMEISPSSNFIKALKCILDFEIIWQSYFDLFNHFFQFSTAIFWLSFTSFVRNNERGTLDHVQFVFDNFKLKIIILRSGMYISICSEISISEQFFRFHKVWKCFRVSQISSKISVRKQLFKLSRMMIIHDFYNFFWL